MSELRLQAAFPGLRHRGRLSAVLQISRWFSGSTGS